MYSWNSLPVKDHLKWKSEAAKTSRMLPLLKRKVRSPCLSKVTGHLNRLPALFFFNHFLPAAAQLFITHSRLFPAFGRVPGRTRPTSPGVNELLDEYVDCSGLLFETKISLSNIRIQVEPSCSACFCTLNIAFAALLGDQQRPTHQFSVCRSRFTGEAQ